MNVLCLQIIDLTNNQEVFWIDLEGLKKLYNTEIEH